MGYYKISFPCGLIIENSTMLHYFGDREILILYEEGCPIHGKKCKKV